MVNTRYELMVLDIDRQNGELKSSVELISLMQMASMYLRILIELCMKWLFTNHA